MVRNHGDEGTVLLSLFVDIFRLACYREDRGRFSVLNEIILNTFPQVLLFHRTTLKFGELKRRLRGIFLYTFLSNRSEKETREPTPCLLFNTPQF